MAQRETRLIQVASLKDGHILIVHDAFGARSRVAFIEKRRLEGTRQMVTGQDLRSGRGAVVYFCTPRSTVRVEKDLWL